MAQYKIYPTELSSDLTTGSYRDFIAVYYQVFPLKIESEYVNLSNLLIDYIYSCRMLNRQNSDIDENIRHLTMLNAKLDAAKAEEDAIYKELASAVKALENNRNSFFYNNIVSIAMRGKDASRKKENLETKTGDYNNYHQETSVSISESRSNIVELIQGIYSSLQRINAFNNGHIKRIDNLAVTERHLAEIDKIAISDIEKQTLKALLVSYVEMRKTAFKILEELAIKLTSAYQNRQLIETMSDSEVNDYTLAATILYAVELGNRHEHKEINPANCHAFMTDASVMNIVTGYLKTKTFDDAKLKELKDSVFLTSAEATALVEMENQRNKLEFTSSGR